MEKVNRVILLSTLIKRSEVEQEELRALLSDKLDWANLIGQLAHHRIMGYFYYGLGEELLTYAMSEVGTLLKLLTTAQEVCNRERLALLKETFDKFEEEGVRYSTLKGLTYMLTMYPYGIRRSNDCDILVMESELKKIDKILTSQGYIQSSDGGNTVAGKREKLIQIMNYHDLIPYYKDTGSQLQQKMELDINFHIDGKDNDITEKAFQYGTRIAEKDGYAGRVLDERINLVQLCIHYHREASNTLWVGRRKDLQLYKLVDIANTLRCMEEEAVLQSLSLAHELGVEKKVYFTLYYLHQFYMDDAYQEYMGKIKFDDMDYLRKVHVEGEGRDYLRQCDLVEETFGLCNY